ncbi:unnamed protein product, partial [Symbiodinium natans]
EAEEEDLPYTQVSFFSDNSMKDSNQMRRRLPTILPFTSSAHTTESSDTPAAAKAARWEMACTWGKFLLVWICMILIVALRGGANGSSIINIKSCSWEYWTSVNHDCRHPEQLRARFGLLSGLMPGTAGILRV